MAKSSTPYTIEDIKAAIKLHETNTAAFEAVAKAAGVKPGSVAIRYYRAMKAKEAKADTTVKAKAPAAKAVSKRVKRAPRKARKAKGTGLRESGTLVGRQGAANLTTLHTLIATVYNVPESLLTALAEASAAVARK